MENQVMDFGLQVRSGRVPCVEGFFGANGSVREVLYDGPQLTWFRLGAPFRPGGNDGVDDLVEIDWARAVA
jgi:hypothetical protein